MQVKIFWATPSDLTIRTESINNWLRDNNVKIIEKEVKFHAQHLVIMFWYEPLSVTKNEQSSSRKNEPQPETVPAGNNLPNEMLVWKKPGDPI